MIHPIAYPCGCVFVFDVDSYGWSIVDKANMETGRQIGSTKMCVDHLKEIQNLGLWGGKR